MNNAKRLTLIAALKAISSQYPQFKFCPVVDKAPKYWSEWQQNGINLDVIIKAIESGRADGFGLVTGDGFIAIDCDGHTAHKKAEELGGLSLTPSWTSGRDGRYQCLYLIPEIYRDALKDFTRKVIITQEETQDKDKEILELRYKGHQSVLAPSAHPKTPGYVEINSFENTPIAECPVWVIELILGDESKPSNSDQLPINFNQLIEPIPLIQLISVGYRANIKSGLGFECGRDDTGFKIACDLIAAEEWAKSNNINYSDSAKDLFLEYCRNCDSKDFTPKDHERIWKSASKSNPTPCLSGDKLENCYSSWLNKQGKKSSTRNSKPNYQTSGNTALKPEQQAETQSNVVQFPRQQPQLNIEEIEGELKSLAEQNLSKSKQQLKIIEIAKKYNLNPKELGDVNKNYLSEIEDTDSLDDIKSELDDFLSNQNQSIDTSKYLPGNLNKISDFAARFCLRPELGLTIFYTTISSLLKVGSKIRLSDYTDFDQPTGIYSAIVAEPSQRKSPLINAIATKPLRELLKKSKDIYAEEMKYYAMDFKEFENDKSGNTPEPIEPTMRQFFVNCGTGAGMRDLINEQAKKSYGITLLADEISGWFKSQSQSYNIGLKEDFLSYYDGFGKRDALKGGLASDFEECLVSVLGGIQPNVFKEFNDGSDDNGSHARFNFINQPTQPFIIPDDPQGELVLLPLLSGFYEKISELPQLELRLSPDAKKQFHSLNNKCELYRVNAKSQALAALWGKMPGKIGRFAALIHIVECVASGQENIDPIVGVGTLTKAANLAKFYYKEAENLYTSCEQGNLTPTLANVLKIAKDAPGAITARDVVRHKLFRTKEFKNLKSADIQILFVQLADMGYGSIQGAGVKIQFCHGLSQVVTANCDKLKTIQDSDSSHLSQLSQEKNKNFKTQSSILDDSTILDEKAKNEKTAVTVVTKPENVYTEPIVTCHNDLGQTVTSRDKTGDRIPDPVENKNTDFDGLDVGDVLIAEFKELHIITARKGQQWLTHRGEYVSRTALQNQDFKVPTIGEMVTAIGKAYVNQDSELAHLLAETFKNDPLSLFCQAIATDKNLEIIYTL
ncbi:DUF3987 domain-containing protein [Planktothrix agardhii]|uniref:DUF3987 domain-containing protein n=1 Tax=Planktothrix agardhii TaxID=1160 RepID=UPI001F2F2514|nr:DUF3987 domain-containing protein [Planktothrix agardhii]MCF3623179.1 DUF3987 domain-containing protein [Planktothrix agardhii 1030]